MRTPVAAIRLLAENLANGTVKEGAERERHLGRLVEQSERLSTLVGNVLSYSRREAGKAEWRGEEIAVADLLSEAVRQFRDLSAERGVVLRCVTGEFAQAPLGDREGLREALANLIDNALKHSPEGGEVVCGADEDAGQAGWWRLWVEDGGPGVAEAERRKVFEAFYRVGPELRRETAGTGLGLALVKQVAEWHGGEAVCLASAAGGARFEVNLPVAPAVLNI
jgi:signal transduction histidine kinase